MSFKFLLNDNKIKIICNNFQKEILVSEFKKNAKLLLKRIKEGSGRSFEIPFIEDFIEQMNLKQIKSNSTNKKDIVIQIHDHKTGFTPILGFSIKSQLGQPSTLFNASQSTNFIYKIDKPIDLLIDKINNLKYKKQRINAIYKRSNGIIFDSVSGKMFQNNLIVIDSCLPIILAYCLEIYYSTNMSKVTDIVEVLREKNPLNYDLSQQHEPYKYKLKKFLKESALGLVATTKWNGIYDATGGYIVVKENGDLVCYHIFKQNQFEDYLFYNTKFDSPSASRNKFGKIYEKNNSKFINLCLQVRFLR